MATIVDERAPFRGRRIAAVSLAILAMLVVLGLGIWLRQSARDQAVGVEQVEEFSPEAVRVRNTAALYVPESFSPEVVRIRNTSALREGQAFSPEVVRMRNWQSLVLDSDLATK
ncbi:MAG TPA: hypothetical protein VFP67_10620 [Acidimicrobiia bacterium]|nr:hypothetical protein [Acidimicrobiia bacterium]HEX5915321.1 hypothetical protein [Rubrobacter sp.]